MIMSTQTLANRPKLGLVLVVDDEEHNRTLLRDPLEAAGYEVMEAEDGSRALELMAGRTPDVVLLDVMMPRMHGFELCQRLRQEPRTASIPILMVTALAERHERLMGIKVGANDFLLKPVDLQDVILRVGNAVKLRQLYGLLDAERERSEGLLRNVLPAVVAERMKAGETTIADAYPEATVLFADLVGFTTLSAHIGAEQVVYLLNEIFSVFDALTEKHGLEKIKTVGDGYLAAGGVPTARPDHVIAVTGLALAMCEAVTQFNAQYDTSIQVRIGIASGPVVAGVIGRKKFSYDLWGQTVNHACRLGNAGEGGAIWVAPATCDLLQDEFVFDRHQPCTAGGKGDFTGYKLLHRRPGRSSAARAELPEVEPAAAGA
jgi:adenylate cyclase